MKNVSNQTTEKIEKCPYQVLAYGENNCDIIYRSSYSGDWGHWDEPVEDNQTELKDSAEYGIEIS